MANNFKTIGDLNIGDTFVIPENNEPYHRYEKLPIPRSLKKLANDGKSLCLIFETQRVNGYHKRLEVEVLDNGCCVAHVRSVK